MSLIQKLSKVMSAVERVPKRGRNEFHKYDYATESDIVATVRSEFSKQQIIMFPSVVGESRHPVGDKGMVLTSLDMKFSFFDGESGENLEFEWKGYGTDKEDKGGYKAMTGGLKYFLLKTFLMPTGDDPEEDRVSQLQNEPPLAVAPPDVKPAGYDAFFSTLKVASSKGEAALKEAWMNGTYEFRKYAQANERAGWEALKTIAASQTQFVTDKASK